MEIRPARNADRRALAETFAAVAAERDGIASEPPVDVRERARIWDVGSTLVAVEDGRIVGHLYLGATRHGFGDVGMAVAKEDRGRGVGSALLQAAIDRARDLGLHKLVLEVFPHNEAAIALYRKFGFVDEGRSVGKYRRQSGELWDVLHMGLLLED